MLLKGLAEAVSPVRLVRPRPDHFSAGRWSHFQTAETVCQRDGWVRCPTQARLCPACRHFSYKSFPLFCQQIMQEPGVARPDCIGTHVLLNTHAAVYIVQLLAIWRIPLLAVVPLLSLALRVGLMRRLPTSSCPFPFPKKPLTLFYICTLPVVYLPPILLASSFMCSGLTTFEMLAPPLLRPSDSVSNHNLTTILSQSASTYLCQWC